MLPKTIRLMLRQRLRPLCNPELKRHQIGVGLEEQAERVLTALGVYYQSDDREELRRQKETLARNLAVLLARVAQSQTFGEMLHRLQVSDHDLYALCAQVTSAMPEAENGGAAPASIGVRVSQQDILDDLFGDEAPVATEMPGTAPVTGKDSAAELAEAVFDAWVEQVRQFAADAETRTFFAMPARERLALVLDDGSFRELDRNLVSKNPLDFPGYPEKLRDLQKKTDLVDTLVTATGKIGGVRGAAARSSGSGGTGRADSSDEVESVRSEGLTWTSRRPFERRKRQSLNSSSDSKPSPTTS